MIGLKMLLDNMKFSISTPAFVYDEKLISKSILGIANTAHDIDCHLLYSLKPLAIINILNSLSTHVDGFATSSLFEARLAREVISSQGTVHITTPGLKPEQMDQIIEMCDYISFNSLSQWSRFRSIDIDIIGCGLRINPQLSFIKDDRYNPSRRASKLGVPLDQLISVISNGRDKPLKGITGIHFHNNCDSKDFNQLFITVEKLDLLLGGFLEQLEWINLGGGYLFQEAESLDPFYATVDLLRSKYNLDIFIEPGAAIVRDAGYIVSGVLDIFKSDDKTIAILDTTVNHMPEVFEYQFEPDVIGHNERGRYCYLLAGASCLAGDIFGEYAFDEPLEIGSRVIFSGMGAYTFVKANMFNGINLPTIYSINEDGESSLVKQFNYEDFTSKCGVNKHEFV